MDSVRNYLEGQKTEEIMLDNSNVNQKDALILSSYNKTEARLTINILNITNMFHPYNEH